MELSKTVKTFLVFGVLTSYVSTLQEPHRTQSKSWFKKFFTLGNSLYKEVKKVQTSTSKEVDYAYDELEEYLMKVIDKSLEVSSDNLEQFVEHINNFKNEKI